MSELLKNTDNRVVLQAALALHTHGAFLKPMGSAGQLVINTGTWLKLLRRFPVRIGFFPAVYVPSFRLNYFQIYEQSNQLVIEYVEIPKQPERELTWLQRLVTLGKQPDPPEVIPSKTTIELSESKQS